MVGHTERAAEYVTLSSLTITSSEQGQGILVADVGYWVTTQIHSLIIC